MGVWFGLQCYIGAAIRPPSWPHASSHTLTAFIIGRLSKIRSSSFTHHHAARLALRKLQVKLLESLLKIRRHSAVVLFYRPRSLPSHTMRGDASFVWVRHIHWGISRLAEGTLHPGMKKAGQVGKCRLYGVVVFLEAFLPIASKALAELNAFPARDAR